MKTLITQYRYSSQTIGFIGVGNMGSGMVQNLAKHYKVLAYDSNPNFMSHIKQKENITVVDSIKNLAKQTDIFVCMLPNEKIVNAVCDGPNGLFQNSPKDSLVIDCSTISPFSARDLNNLGSQQHSIYVDSPVSGGVGAAAAGTLTFMVGTDKMDIFQLCEQVLGKMGKNVFKCDSPGNGQSAKICNNMALGIEMVAVSEALALGVKLGLDPKLLSRIMNVSSSRCWSSEVYNPAPGVIPTVPSSNNYDGGFSTELMLKDLTIATQVAKQVDSSVPLGDHTYQIYKTLADKGLSKKDFSIVYDQILKKQI